MLNWHTNAVITINIIHTTKQFDLAIVFTFTHSLSQKISAEHFDINSSCTQTHMYEHTHACTHTHMHTHACTHIHAHADRHAVWNT